jgi:hypothetical protein
MTLLDAQQYDAARERRLKIRIASIVVIVLVIAGLVWTFRYLPQERLVDHFFDALQNKDYETAYGIWLHDPQWKQHPAKYHDYPFDDFYRDWGPGGEWGLIKSHSIYGAASPRGGGSGIIVEVVVNQRLEHARIWVENKDKTLSFSPF